MNKLAVALIVLGVMLILFGCCSTEGFQRTCYGGSTHQ